MLNVKWEAWVESCTLYGWTHLIMAFKSNEGQQDWDHRCSPSKKPSGALSSKHDPSVSSAGQELAAGPEPQEQPLKRRTEASLDARIDAIWSERECDDASFNALTVKKNVILQISLAKNMRALRPLHLKK